MNSKHLSISLIGAVLSLASLSAQQISSEADCITGGRGGVVYHVFRTDDPVRGAFGTLRYAVEQHGARTIVFDTRGPITLTRDLVLYSPDVTIAGQTAEIGFVGITGHRIVVSCDNVVIEGLYYTPSSDVSTQSLTLQDILSTDSNMNGIPDQKEKLLFGELVDGNGHILDPEKTNLEWYLSRLHQELELNGVSAISKIPVAESKARASDSISIGQTVIGLAHGEYQINGQKIIVR